jgi:hypothetical protein
MKKGALGLALVFLSVAVLAQEAPDPSEIINQLLSGIAGFKDMTGEELEKEVGEVGGIPFRREVPLDFMSRDDLARYVSDLFDAEYPESRAQADQRTLVGFDLLDKRTNLRELRKKLLLENIAGFYDERPGKKRLYAVSPDRRLSPANQIILSHELRHALQDQYADVHGVLPDSVGDFDDRRIAFLSVLEGDATLVMEKFTLLRMGAAAGMDTSGLSLPAAPIAGAPPILADQLVLPYVRGLAFIQAVYDKGGWDAVRDTWAHPPDSTDEILNPEHYLEHRHSQNVEVAYAPQGGRLLNDGVLGEIFIMTLLGPDAPAPRGWRGDHYRVFDLAGRTLLVWRSVWDTPAATGEFEKALTARFSATHGAPQSQNGFAVFRKGEWSCAVGRKDGIFFLASDDPGVLERALRDLH